MTTSPSVNPRQLSALQLDPDKIGFPRSVPAAHRGWRAVNPNQELHGGQEP